MALCSGLEQYYLVANQLCESESISCEAWLIGRRLQFGNVFLYVKAPRGGARTGRPRRPEKSGRPIAIRWLRMKENLAISEY